MEQKGESSSLVVKWDFDEDEKSVNDQLDQNVVLPIHRVGFNVPLVQLSKGLNKKSSTKFVNCSVSRHFIAACTSTGTLHILAKNFVNEKKDLVTKLLLTSSEFLPSGQSGFFARKRHEVVNVSNTQGKGNTSEDVLGRLCWSENEQYLAISNKHNHVIVLELEYLNTQDKSSLCGYKLFSVYDDHVKMFNSRVKRSEDGNEMGIDTNLSIVSLCFNKKSSVLYSGDSVGVVLSFDIEQQKKKNQSIKILKSLTSLSSSMKTDTVFIEDSVEDLSQINENSIFQIESCLHSEKSSKSLKSILLISSLKKTIIFYEDEFRGRNQTEEKQKCWIMVGTKPRDGEHGACFIDVVRKGKKQLYCFCSRPGKRLWCANIISGKVLSTLKGFKSKYLQLNINVSRLTKIFAFGQNYMLVCNETEGSVLLIDLLKVQIIDCKIFKDNILKVSVYDQECYILYGSNNNLARLAIPNNKNMKIPSVEPEKKLTPSAIETPTQSRNDIPEKKEIESLEKLTIPQDQSNNTIQIPLKADQIEAPIEKPKIESSPRMAKPSLSNESQAKEEILLIHTQEQWPETDATEMVIIPSKKQTKEKKKKKKKKKKKVINLDDDEEEEDLNSTSSDVTEQPVRKLSHIRASSIDSPAGVHLDKIIENINEQDDEINNEQLESSHKRAKSIDATFSGEKKQVFEEGKDIKQDLPVEEANKDAGFSTSPKEVTQIDNFQRERKKSIVQNENMFEKMEQDKRMLEDQKILQQMKIERENEIKCKDLVNGQIEILYDQYCDYKITLDTMWCIDFIPNLSNFIESLEKHFRETNTTSRNIIFLHNEYNTFERLCELLDFWISQMFTNFNEKYEEFKSDISDSKRDVNDPKRRENQDEWEQIESLFYQKMDDYFSVFYFFLDMRKWFKVSNWNRSEELMKSIWKCEEKYDVMKEHSNKMDSIIDSFLKELQKDSSFTSQAIIDSLSYEDENYEKKYNVIKSRQMNCFEVINLLNDVIDKYVVIERQVKEEKTIKATKLKQSINPESILIRYIDSIVSIHYPTALYFAVSNYPIIQHYNIKNSIEKLVDISKEVQDQIYINYLMDLYQYHPDLCSKQLGFVQHISELLIKNLSDKDTKQLLDIQDQPQINGMSEEVINMRMIMNDIIYKTMSNFRLTNSEGILKILKLIESKLIQYNYKPLLLMLYKLSDSVLEALQIIVELDDLRSLECYINEKQELCHDEIQYDSESQSQAEISETHVEILYKHWILLLNIIDKQETPLKNITLDSVMSMMCMHLTSTSILQVLNNCSEEFNSKAINVSIYQKICELAQNEIIQSKLKHELLECVDSYMWTEKENNISPQARLVLNYSPMVNKKIQGSDSEVFIETLVNEANVLKEKKETDMIDLSELSELKSLSEKNERETKPKSYEFTFEYQQLNRYLEDTSTHWGIQLNRDNLKCNVCSSPLHDAIGQELIVFKCTHVFHKACCPAEECVVCHRNNFVSLLSPFHN